MCDRLLTALSLASRKSDNFGTVSSSLLICKVHMRSKKSYILTEILHVISVKFNKTFFISEWS